MLNFRELKLIRSWKYFLMIVELQQNLQNIVLRISIHSVLLKVLEILYKNNEIESDKYIELDNRLEIMFTGNMSLCTINHIEALIKTFVEQNITENHFKLSLINKFFNSTNEISCKNNIVSFFINDLRPLM